MVIYQVTVSDKASGLRLDSTTIPVGQWKEIGYWLDNLGYIEPGYEITITVEIPL